MTDPQPAPVSNKKKAFSIVSAIVVVVLIVGCLGAIATPKFGAFQCKSKQSEAKVNLSGIFTSEKAFLGEYGFYSTDLKVVNWRPDGAPVYAYGFAAPSAPGPVAGISDYDPTRRTTLDARIVALGGYSVSKMSSLTGRAYADADFQAIAPTATATTGAFLAVAIGDIDSDRDEKLDVWTIDATKNLAVVRNDCID